MKRGSFIMIAAFLISVCFSMQPLSAQKEKTKEEKEKEMKLQQAIDQQKKAMMEQKKAQDLADKEIEKSLQEAQESVQKSNDVVNLYRSRSHSSGRDLQELDQPFMVSPGGEFSGFGRFWPREGDSERTTWDFSKQVKETTFSRQYSFDVEESASTVVMTVMGDCKAGDIRVKIIMPGGKVYSDIVIDEFGNLNWRKSFTISEDENKDKAGEWVFKIEAEKATGFFKISLQTY
jgi:hypothetical protein